MPRKPRLAQQAVCYHLLNRGVNRMKLFHAARDYQRFSELVCEAKESFHAKIYHWVWMPNHYHLIVQIPFPLLCKFAGRVQQRYAAYHHRTRGSSGILWQGRFKSFAVETDLSLLRCGRYMERNPVRAGMFPIASDHPWSSARFYVMGKEDYLTDPDPHFSQFPLSPKQHDNYRKLLESSEDDSWFQEQLKAKPDLKALGSKAFLSRFKSSKGSRFAVRRGRPRITM